jgi:hypothetical protein
MADELVKIAKKDVGPIVKAIRDQIEHTFGSLQAFKKAKAAIWLNAHDMAKVGRLFELTGWHYAEGDTYKLFDKPVLFNSTVNAPTIMVLS